jgi:alkanesulfonate monooxygenase SsuD/methylene tetrahydromethanopterin reductase-like flavin-dependent oxidoreductase (luciferase family)
MKIGMTLPTMVPGLDRRTVLEWARRIDAGPFSTLAAGERIAFPNQEMLVTLAVAAGVTERVRIAFTVVVLPMHSTLLMAKQLATLDVLSAGRVTVGIGVGGREEDYRAAGASFDHRLTRMEQQVALMRRAWAGEVAMPGIAPVGPEPVQKGGPEILAGSLTPRSIRRAARFADGICGFSFGPDAGEVGAAFDVARAAWREQGRPAPRLVTSCWFALGKNARAEMDVYVRRYLDFLGTDTAASIAPLCSVVSPDALRDTIRAIAATGADELILVPASADPSELDRVADVVAQQTA